MLGANANKMKNISSLGSGYKLVQVTVGLIIVGIIYLIYLPICIYGIYKYNKHKNWIVMRKRYQWITVFILINLVLSLLLLPILIILIFSESKYAVSYICILYGVIVFAINVGWKMCWRLWMYYYDIKWIYAVSNRVWESLIDKRATENNWFINNRDKYGNWRYWLTPYFCIVFINLFLVTLWEYALPSNLEDYKDIFVFVTVAVISL
eukprot:214447_1